MNLVELDAPAAPKRTCSLPNLAWTGTITTSSVVPGRQAHRDTLLFFQQHAASTLSRGALGGSDLSPCPGCLRREARRQCAWLVARASLCVACCPSLMMCGCDSTMSCYDIFSAKVDADPCCAFRGKSRASWPTPRRLGVQSPRVSEGTSPATGAVVALWLPLHFIRGA